MTAIHHSLALVIQIIANEQICDRYRYRLFGFYCSCKAIIKVQIAFV